jgi:signal transduction histidine kinase
MQDRSRRDRRGVLTPLAAAILWPATADAAPLPFGSTHSDLGQLAVSLGLVLVTTATTYVFARARIRATEREAELRGTIAQLQTRLDRSEALLSAEPQIIATFGHGEELEVTGALPTTTGVPGGRRALGFGAWLGPEEAARVEQLVDTLRERGEGFDTSVPTRRGGYVALDGRAVGGRAVVRIRSLEGERLTIAELEARQHATQAQLAGLKALLDGVPQPAWMRDAEGKLSWVNAAYVRSVEAVDADAAVAAGMELFDTTVREKAGNAAATGGGVFRYKTPAIAAGERHVFDIHEIRQGSGRAGLAVDVTDLEDMRTDLSRRVASHRKTLDELTTGVAIFRSDGRLAFHNHAFRQLWRLDSMFLQQEPTDSAILDRLRAEEALPEPSNYREWKAQLQEAYRSVEPREHWWHLPDSRTMRVVQTPNPEGGVTYLFDDVSERIDLESRYNAMIRVQRETLDNLRDGVAVFGSDGRLRLYNPVFAQMWKLPATELSASPHARRIFSLCRVLHQPPEPWEMLTTAVTAMQESRLPVSGRIERADGASIDIASVPMPDGATIVTFSDVSAGVAMERALKDRNEALEAADRLKNAFVKHVSYELRSPLTNIIGFTELLADPSTGPLTTRQREYAGHILDSSNSLYTIINDILDLATIDAGAMELELSRVDVRSAVQSAVEGVRGRLAGAGLTLEISIPAGAGSFVADENRVRQVLFNLLSNAIGFSPEGGKVSLVVGRNNDCMTFTVSDNGPGIPAEVIEKVFDRFESHTEGSRHRGVGLGLSIVRSFVELHGGKVWIDPSQGQGTRITCTLPLDAGAARLAAE